MFKFYQTLMKSEIFHHLLQILKCAIKTVRKQKISLALHKVKINFNINIKEVPLSAIIIRNLKFWLH